MTAPTQTQVDAALRAYSEAGAGHRGGMVAALTAAAQVKPLLDQRVLREASIDATIERCAAVADTMDCDHRIGRAIAAAIRALATEATKATRSPSSPSRAPR